MTGFYTVTGSVLQCVTACAAPNYYGVDATYDSNSQRCDASCALIAGEPFQSGYSCNASCLTGTIYYEWFNASFSVCYAECPSSIPYAEANNSCTSLCLSGNYNITAGSQASTQTLWCKATCWANTYVVNASNSNSHQCVANCYSQTGLTFISASSY